MEIANLTGGLGTAAYRYGFNGKEKDQSGEFGGNTTYDYGFRIYNPAVGRFLSVDPLTSSYPWYTPYQFAGNKPIAAIDLDGLEEVVVVNSPWYISKILTHLKLAQSDDRFSKTHLKEALRLAYKTTEIKAKNSYERKVFGGDMAGTKERIGPDRIFIIKFKQQDAFSYIIPGEALEYKYNGIDPRKEIVNLRHKGIQGGILAVGIGYGLGLDILLTKGRFTKDILAQFLAQGIRKDGDAGLALEDVDFANAFFKAALGGDKKFTIVEEALKTVFDVSIDQGIRMESLDNINNVVKEFGLRLMFKNKAPGANTSAAGEFTTDVVVKAIRGETQEAISEEVKD